MTPTRSEAEVFSSPFAASSYSLPKLQLEMMARTLPEALLDEPGVMVQKMRLGAPDSSGRQSPEVIEGADYVEQADLVIKALGFEPEDIPALWDTPELEVTRWGTIKADFRSHEPSLGNVYAVGDIVRGASLVVWAIRDGREAADEMLARFDTARAGVAAE